MRFIFGALAGLVAAVAMTSFMRQAHPHLPASQKYPLPSREIIDRTIGSDTEVAARSRTILMHFGFGALTGGLFAIPSNRRIGGVAYGLPFGQQVISAGSPRCKYCHRRRAIPSNATY